MGFLHLKKKLVLLVGITNELTKKYDAVSLVKIVSSKFLVEKVVVVEKILHKLEEFKKDKIEEAFKALSKKIN